jgi:hypothetical protein
MQFSEISRHFISIPKTHASVVLVLLTVGKFGAISNFIQISPLSFLMESSSSISQEPRHFQGRQDLPVGQGPDNGCVFQRRMAVMIGPEEKYVRILLLS